MGHRSLLSESLSRRRRLVLLSSVSPVAVRMNQTNLCAQRAKRIFWIPKASSAWPKFLCVANQQILSKTCSSLIQTGTGCYLIFVGTGYSKMKPRHI